MPLLLLVVVLFITSCSETLVGEAVSLGCSDRSVTSCRGNQDGSINTVERGRTRTYTDSCRSSPDSTTMDATDYSCRGDVSRRSCRTRCDSLTEACVAGRCIVRCGNGVQDAGENCLTCPVDVSCAAGEECQDSVCVPLCGNSVINEGENCLTCPVDNSCAAGEECQDSVCVPLCGNSVINEGENCLTCPVDVSCPANAECVGTGICNPRCGNGRIDLSEDCGNCPVDVNCDDYPCASCLDSDFGLNYAIRGGTAIIRSATSSTSIRPDRCADNGQLIEGTCLDGFGTSQSFEVHVDCPDGTTCIDGACQSATGVCTAEALDEYRCNANLNFQERRYRYTDCSEGWYAHRYCHYGCNIETAICFFPNELTYNIIVVS